VAVHPDCEHKHIIVMEDRIWCKVCASFLPSDFAPQVERDLLAVADSTGVLR
jgi:hypothetical protein